MAGTGQWNLNKIWTEDYSAGIATLVALVNDSIVCIEKEEQFYEWFINDWSSFLLQELGKKAQDTDLVEHEALRGLATNLGKSFNVGHLRTSCLEPLQVILKQTKSRRDGMEGLLRTLLLSYLKDLKAMREALEMYNRKAETSPRMMKEVSHLAQFPIKLDEHLKFNDEVAFQEFLDKVKQAIPVQRKGFMNYLGIEGKASFQGKHLMDGIKKSSEKLDTSPYNLDRLGQRLLDLDLIREDALAIGSKQTFNQEGSYSWVEDANGVLDKKTFSGWVKVLSSTSISDLTLETLETRYFEKCHKLEFAKFQLEKAIYEGSEAYLKFSAVEIDQVLTKNQETFSKLFGLNKPSSTKEDRQDTFNCYLRNSTIPIIKWEPVRDSLERRTLMFGAEEIDDDTVEAIAVILRHVQGFAEEAQLKTRVSMAWAAKDAMEMDRAINLKMELIKTFRLLPNATNLKCVESVIRSNRYHVANDWVNLIKLWLLELPDSLIPPKCVAKDNQLSLAQVPRSNLLVLMEMCSHFQWLGTDAAQMANPVSHYFFRRLDVVHSFHDDCKTFGPWITTFLLDPASQTNLQELYRACTVLTPPATPTPAVTAPEIQVQETTPPPAHLDDSFTPRPFRTASAASSLPGSPALSANRNSRRISGLVLEPPDPLHPATS